VTAGFWRGRGSRLLLFLLSRQQVCLPPSVSSIKVVRRTTGCNILMGLVFPHLEYRYLPGYNHEGIN
jgi:hypothetical protein